MVISLHTNNHLPTRLIPTVYHRSFERTNSALNGRNPRNKKIFSIIKQLLDKNILVTPITLKNHLENENEDNY